MDFIFDHVLQALIIGWSKENHDLHLLTGEPIVHHLVSSELVTQAMELA